MRKHYRKLRLVVQLGIGALFVLGGLENLPVTLLIILVSTVLAGPVFCGWVCPFGTLQDLVSQLTRGVKKRHMPKGLQSALAISRYVLLGVTTLLTADIVFAWMALDARINLLSTLSGNVLTVGAYAVLAIYLVVAVFFERPFCSYLCPQGAKYGLMSSLRPFRVVRNESACVNCRKCNQACPMHIDIMGHQQVTSLQCISCMNCVAACPKKGALKFGVIKLGRKGMAAYLAVVILAVASATGMAAYQLTTEDTAVSAAEAEAVSAMQSETTDTTVVGTQPIEQSASQGTTTEAASSAAASPEASTTTTDMSASNQAASNKTAQASSSTKAAAPSVAQSQSVASKTSTTVSSTAAKTETQSNTQAVQPTATPSTTTVAATVSGEAAGIADGTYTGEAIGFKGPITVAVTVQNQQIANIEVLDNVDDRKWFNRALSVVDDMLAAQSTKVDTVTGATYSSRGIIEAAKAALNNAK